MYYINVDLHHYDIHDNNLYIGTTSILHLYMSSNLSLNYA